MFYCIPLQNCGCKLHVLCWTLLCWKKWEPVDYLSLIGFPARNWKHQRILAFLSSNSASTAGGVTSCDSPQRTSGRAGGQHLQSTKPAGRNSCHNSQNSFFFQTSSTLYASDKSFSASCWLLAHSNPLHTLVSPPFTSLWLLSSSLPSSSLLPSPLILYLVLSEPSSLPEALRLHQSKFCWTSSLCYSPSLPVPPSHPLLTKSSGHFLSSQSNHLAQPCPVLT